MLNDLRVVSLLKNPYMSSPDLYSLTAETAALPGVLSFVLVQLYPGRGRFPPGTEHLWRVGHLVAGVARKRLGRAAVEVTPWPVCSSMYCPNASWY